MLFSSGKPAIGYHYDNAPKKVASGQEPAIKMPVYALRLNSPCYKVKKTQGKYRNRHRNATCLGMPVCDEKRTN